MILYNKKDHLLLNICKIFKIKKKLNILQSNIDMKIFNIFYIILFFIDLGISKIKYI